MNILIKDEKLINTAYLDLFSYLIYYDTDTINSIYWQTKDRSIPYHFQLVNYNFVKENKVSDETIVPVRIKQTTLKDDKLNQIDIVMFLTEAEADEDYFQSVYNHFDQLKERFKEIISFSYIEADVEEVEVDPDNRILTMPKAYTDKDKTVQLLISYAHMLTMNEHQIFYPIIDYLLVRHITRKAKPASVPISHIIDIKENEMNRLMNIFRETVLQTLWDLYEKCFTWEEICLLWYADDVIDNLVGYYGDLYQPLSEKLMDLSDQEICSLKDYLQKGLTVYPVCRLIGDDND